MSRTRQALAAVTMAVAAAGGGLLAAVASAVPASAATPGHTVTISAHPRATAGHGAGPRTILPCAVRPGATPASCGQQTISCSITSNTPFISAAAGAVYATASVSCTSSVTTISLTSALLKNGTTVNTDSDPEQGTNGAATLVGAACQAGSYVSTASALITFPPGWVLTAGTNPIHQTSASIQAVTSLCHPPADGGGGGGGGCAIRGPSLASHPAGRHPDLISCS